MQKITSKLGSLRQQIIVVLQFLRVRHLGAAWLSAFGSRALEVAVELLAMVAVVKRLDWGWRIWF